MINNYSDTILLKFYWLGLTGTADGDHSDDQQQSLWSPRIRCDRVIVRPHVSPKIGSAPGIQVYIYVHCRRCSTLQLYFYWDLKRHTLLPCIILFYWWITFIEKQINCAMVNTVILTESKNWGIHIGHRDHPFIYIWYIFYIALSVKGQRGQQLTVIKNQSLYFDRKVLRKVCGLIRNPITREYERRRNSEL